MLKSLTVLCFTLLTASTIAFSALDVPKFMEGLAAGFVEDLDLTEIGTCFV